MHDAEQRETEHSFFDRLKNCAALFGNLSLALLIAFFAARIMEFLYVSMTNSPPADFWTIVVQALLFDIVSFLEMLPFLFVPFAAVYFIADPASNCRFWIYFGGGLIMLLLYAALIKYFATALVPLGSDLFGYSLKEISETVKGGVTFDKASVLLFIVPVIAFWISLAFLYSGNVIKPLPAFVLLGISLLLAFTVSVMPSRTSFRTEFSYTLALNKPAFFIQDAYAYFTRSAKRSVNSRASKVEAKQPDAATASKSVNSEYPFLRTDDARDVLGEFFRISPSSPPNFVFILVEGLGKAFSGPHAYLGSFTPFLDELSRKSLSWENFLASQGRTFAALPSILASLPYAEQGFSDLGKRMPKHLSFMSILKHNGYRLKFYFGSDLDFDNERQFLQKQGVDVMIGINDYDKSYEKSPGTDWGYADRELIRKSLDMERQDPKQPFVTFVQTMSMHTSYSIPEQEKYIRLFEERMNQLGFDNAQKEKHRPYEKIYSTIMYTDDALRYFFEQYAKLPAYGNTIFIITGDHRLPEIPMSTKIDRFHVPLIIFSPLLKRTAQIQSISSQLDITPSLLAFLKKNYRLDVPSVASWVGTGLDTDPSFRNIHKYPLKHTKTNLIDYISGMYFIDQDTLFSIGKYMDLEPIQDEKKKNQLIAEFNQYKSLNDRFTRELKLIPDSLYKQYHTN